MKLELDGYEIEILKDILLYKINHGSSYYDMKTYIEIYEKLESVETTKKE